MAPKKQKTDEALQLLEKGLTQLLKSGDWKSYLKLQSAFHHYSFNNVLLILTQCPHATRVASYNRWKEFGRQVKKGEKSLKILAPIKKKIPKKDDEGDEEIRIALCGFKTVSVFDISQTEGQDLPEKVSPLTGDDQGLLECLVAFSNSNNVPVLFQGLLSGANGCCRFERTTGRPIEIVVDPLLPKPHQAKTLGHEIGHSILHSRSQYQNHIPRSLAELEAESVAFVVLHHFGLDSSDYSFPYIAGWQKDEDALENLKEAGSRIHKAANQIIDWVENYAPVASAA